VIRPTVNANRSKIIIENVCNITNNIADVMGASLNCLVVTSTPE